MQTALVCLFLGYVWAAPPPVGANLDGVVDWSGSLQFADVIKSSRAPFGSAQVPYDGKAKVDALGWPEGNFGVVIDTNGLTGLGGVYKLSCDGYASGIRAEASSATVQNWNYDPVTKKTTCDIVVPNTDTQLMLGFFNATAGVKNLSIMRPGYPSTAVFSTPFLNQLQLFVGNINTFRFMDWARTNNNPVSTWAQRAQPNQAQFTGDNGVAWEYIIELGNLMKKDIWVNVPHMATDDYVRQFAQLLKQNLDADRNVYVEYSNEVWNWQFQQATWNLDEAVKEVNAGGSPLNYDGSTNKYYWGWRRVGLRIKQISDIFAEVWGQDAINTRVKPVLAGQIANPEVLKQGVEMLKAVYGSVNKYVYALAGAPYFNLGGHDKDTLTVDQVLEYLNDNVQSLKNSSSVQAHATMARFYDVKYFAYEGGVDTFGPNNIKVKKDAELDPRFKQICIDYLNIWFGWGFENFNWFVAGAGSWDGQYGTWPLTYDPRILDTTKIQAINYVLSQPNPPLVAGFPVPGEVDARLFSGCRNCKQNPYLEYLGVNSTFDYLVRSEEAGQVSVSVSFATTEQNALLGLWANGEFITNVVAPTGSWSKFVYSKPVSIMFTKGLNVIRIIVLTNRGYNIQFLKVEQ